MALGTPVVTSNRSSLPEVVGEAALTVDPTNAVAIADALEKVLSDGQLALSLSAAGVERAKRFTWDRAAAETAAVYAAAARGSPPN
jgi:glycosyltransferase involved in cell wall biosynthesis